MKTVVLWLLASLLVLNVRAQESAPEPGPGHALLGVWTGKWEYSGTSYATPNGKAGTFKGTQTGRTILNGFYVESRWSEKADLGDQKGIPAEGLDVYGYDAATKTYTVTSFDRDGGRAEGTLTVEGDTWKQTSTRRGPDGKTSHYRFVMVFSEGGKRISMKCETQTDDGKWIPSWDLAMKKVGRAR